MSTQSLSETILGLIDKHDGSNPLDTLQISSILSEDHQKVVGAVKSLQLVDNLINVQEKSLQVWELTDEGRGVAEKGINFDSSNVIFFSV